MFRRIEAAMKLCGITQSSLALKMGMAPSTLSLKLNGKAAITLREAQKMKSILMVETPIEELFEEYEPQPRAG